MQQIKIIPLLALALVACFPSARANDLGQAHKGTHEIDMQFLNRAPQSEDVQAFFSDLRQEFGANERARFSDLPEIGILAKRHELTHLGGPMLGVLTADGARVWVRTIKPSEVVVVVKTSSGEQRFGPVHSTKESDLVALVPVSGLKTGNSYPYTVLVDGKAITMPADASITPASLPDKPAKIKIAFGADFHKSGLWNRPLLDQIRKRGNEALLLLGDNAVDDRDAKVGLHRSDYQLRDLSPGWQELAALVPIYATWDDHDYFNNDLSGIPLAAPPMTAPPCGRCGQNPGTTHHTAMAKKGSISARGLARAM